MKTSFNYIYFILFWPLLSPSSRTFYDSVMRIGLFPDECLFFGLVLWCLIFLSHLFSYCPLFKNVWIISYLLSYSLVFSCSWALWLLKSYTAVSSAWKGGAEISTCIHSLFIHISELQGNIYTKKPLHKNESTIEILLRVTLNLCIILRDNDSFLIVNFPIWKHRWLYIQFKFLLQCLVVFSVWVVQLIKR